MIFGGLQLINVFCIVAYWVEMVEISGSLTHGDPSDSCLIHDCKCCYRSSPTRMVKSGAACKHIRACAESLQGFQAVELCGRRGIR